MIFYNIFYRILLLLYSNFYTLSSVFIQYVMKYVTTIFSSRIIYIYIFYMLFVLIPPINLLRNLRIRVTSTSTHHIHSR